MFERAGGPGPELRGIYAIVEPERAALEPFIDALLDGGVRLFQIRAKGGIARETVLSIARRVRTAGGLTIVNDDVELAACADGVHLGQEDAALLDLRAVRARLGERIIGLSCGTADEARAVDRAAIDYIGVGPMFATRSKADAGLPIGERGVRAVVDATALPVAAIGGIDLAGIAQVRQTGAAMAAIISALAGADAAARARAFVAAWNA